MTDRTELGRFLRGRREALRPADVGLIPGGRRGTPGLRREEVAILANISTDYYGRLEQARGVSPSESTLASLVRVLRLSTDEGVDLYAVAGYQPPQHRFAGGYAEPGLMHIVDALAGTPAQIVDDLGTVIVQNAAAVALPGPLAGRLGHQGNGASQWFTEPDARRLYPEEDHEALGRSSSPTCARPSTGTVLTPRANPWCTTCWSAARVRGPVRARRGRHRPLRPQDHPPPARRPPRPPVRRRTEPRYRQPALPLPSAARHRHRRTTGVSARPGQRDLHRLTGCPAPATGSTLTGAGGMRKRHRRP